MPAAASRATSAGVKMPLSPTSSRSAGTSGARRSDTASVVSKVLRSRLLMPSSGEARRSARSSSASSCTSTQHVHAELDRRVLQRSRLVVGDGGHDDEDAVGAPGARLVDLVGLEHEILAQRRQRHGRARRVRNSGAPWKEGASVSTERQAAPPAA